VLVLSTICAVLVIAVAIFVCFAYADRVQCLLGAGGTDVAVRLSAFILFCLGIQILGPAEASCCIPWSIRRRRCRPRHPTDRAGLLCTA